MDESDSLPLRTDQSVVRPPSSSAKETIMSARKGPVEVPFPAVEFQSFAHARCGATHFSTGLATFEGGATIPYHKHEYSEAITVLEGKGLIWTEGNCHRLGILDCTHLPRGVAHRAQNPDDQAPLVVHWAHASPVPIYQPVQEHFSTLPNGRDTVARSKETIVRRADAATYELAPGTRFYDLFAGRCGSVGICGGYGEFDPGSSLPCHFHEFDESISIITGEAICEVAGNRYRLSGCDTAFVPKWRPHRFLNLSSELMAMIWVYAGSEPERTLVDTGYCTGGLKYS